jgi:hypothetical protein
MPDMLRFAYQTYSDYLMYKKNSRNWILKYKNIGTVCYFLSHTKAQEMEFTFAKLVT